MPAERISKQFKDLSMSFQINPLNNDMVALKNETAISRAVRNLVLTIPGERFFDPILGTSIEKSLFENMDDTSAAFLKEEIELTIKNYEPRVELINISVDPNYDTYEYNVVIQYNIVGIDVLPQQLSFALQPTR